MCGRTIYGVCPLLVLALSALAIADARSSGDRIRAPSRPRFGGPCDYTRHPGTATIVRVLQTAPARDQASAQGGAGYAGYEVWFTFSPRVELEGELARRAASGEHLFQLANSWYPGPRYLEKYHVAPGASFDCELLVISRGTCTPTLFDIPAMPKDDYFESKVNEWKPDVQAR